MIVGNFFNIKNTNGLFYYGVDYLQERPSLVRKILVRPALLEPMRKLMPQCVVQGCGFAGLLWEAAAAALRGDLLYIPTPHPLPFISRQWVVVHDSYPFTARLGRLKRILLRMSLAASNCRVAYINESETLPFLRRLRIPESRLVFAPNRMPHPPAFRSRPIRRPGEPLTVGLVGTESPKKNYAQLFDAALAARMLPNLNFHAYGHRCAYYDGLVRNHPQANLVLFESDHYGLDEFLSTIDVLVSVADQEGFGRPIAAALAGGIPGVLLSKPVFREFFPGADFHGDVTSLVQELGKLALEPARAAPAYVPPARMMDAYAGAAAALQRESSSGQVPSA